MLGSAIPKQASLLHSPYAFILLRFKIVRRDIQKIWMFFLFRSMVHGGKPQKSTRMGTARRMPKKVQFNAKH